MSASFVCLQASAAAMSAGTMLYLPPTVAPDTCGDLGGDLVLRGTHGIGENHVHEAIFVSCWLCK